jgi:hypothetical protein
MEERKLHIVCHDVPYPPDYGGVFDLYYTIRNLHEQGIKIHLHCFISDRDEQPVLNILEQVYYYLMIGAVVFSPAFTSFVPVQSRIARQVVAG